MSPADELVREIREIMWPTDDPERPWDADTLPDIGDAIAAADVETRGGSKADKVIERINSLLSDPDSEWDADLLEEVAFVMQGAALGPVQVAVAEVSPADLDAINRHRSGLGMGPIDPAAGWTAKELAGMAESIRKTGTMANPRTAELKRRLMR